MDSEEWVFSGEDARDLMDMICTMARYIEGPGFNGFLAWMDQQWPMPAGASAVIRRNIEMLREKIGAA